MNYDEIIKMQRIKLILNLNMLYFNIKCLLYLISHPWPIRIRPITPRAPLRHPRNTQCIACSSRAWAGKAIRVCSRFLRGRTRPLKCCSMSVWRTGSSSSGLHPLLIGLESHPMRLFRLRI